MDEWPREVTTPLKYLARVIAGQAPPSESVSELTSGLAFVQGNAEFGPGHPRPMLQCDRAPKIAVTGDILLSVRAPVGAINVADRTLGIGRGLAAIRPNAGTDGRYLRYVISSSISALRSLATGTTYEAITADDISGLLVPRVSADEQRRIADFLDDQVARIDSIVAARHQQLALIEEAVTSRLAELFFIGSTVPMRRLVREAVVGIVVQPAKYYVDVSCGVPALRGTNVDEGEISTADLVEISHEGHRLHPRSQLIARDVVVVRTGDAGAACVVPDWAIGWNCIDLVIVRANGATEPQYIEHALNAARRNTAIAAAASGSIQQHFGVGALLDLPVRWRGPDEQRKVVASADEAREYANVGSRVLAESVAMLAELKRSLITSTVTGQLDVSTADGSQIPS